MKNYIFFLFNGGLVPAAADSVEIRRRRIVSCMIFLLLFIGSVLLSINLLIFDSPVENFHIAVMLVLGVISLLLQAHKGWVNFAAMTLVAVFILAPTSIIIQVGLTGVSWAWIFPSVVIANLILGRRTALVAAGIGISCILTFAVLTQLGILQINFTTSSHPNAVAVTGSLLLVIICAAGFTFRTIQIIDEARLTTQILRLNMEVEVRREAEIAALSGKKAKATFLENISHELRTPLNGVIGASQLLSDKATSVQEQELVDVVKDSGEILLDLVNNVLDLSQMEDGKLELDKQPIHLRATVKSALTSLVVMGRKKGVSVNFNAEESVPDYIQGDSTRLRQIILNICGNALKFTETGKIDVSLTKSGNKLKIEITDTGIGISKNDQGKLFQAFVQADSSTSRLFGGSGLGLSIVAQLVELFGGEISVQSEVGSGSTFTLLLPIHEIDAKTIDSENDHLTSALPSQNNSRILVTDDNAVNRLVAGKMLEKLGCTVVEAEDGQQALIALQNHTIDMVLMDVQMPIMDGLTATKHIRKLAAPCNNLPIIGFSAHTMELNQKAMLAAGMNYCLSKPIKLEQLQSVLTDFISSDQI